MPRLVSILLLSAALIIAVSLSGCDTTADRELRRAERALNEALEVNADSYATDDYTAAEELFQEAMELSRNNRIQEARAAAIKVKLRAEDAQRKAEERHRILQDEMDRLGR
ncbi:MAG: hypothetical protein V2A61_02595 [Calditrichota bacterium]